MRAARFHTSESVPEPMCEWSVRMTSRWRAAVAFTSSRYWCQIPKLADGPPVLVRLVEPLPSPGFRRTAMARPGAAWPKASSSCREQAFRTMPRAANSGSRRHGICDVSWIRSAANPARSARSTSQSLEASMWRPRSRNRARMPRLGFAFIA